MCKFRKIVGKPELSDQFNKIVLCIKGKAYIIDVIKLSACPVTVDHFAFLINYMPVGRGYLKLFIRWFWLKRIVCFSPNGVQLVVFFCCSIPAVCLTPKGSLNVSTCCFC